MATLTFLLLIGAIPLFPILGLHLLRFLLRSVGNHLRRKTDARRELILERVKLDEQQLSPTLPAATKTEDEDWEKVESYAVGTARNGDAHQDNDYAGIIGFFHPFW
jgi:alpha-1,2-mannosyltransferase